MSQSTDKPQPTVPSANESMDFSRFAHQATAPSSDKASTAPTIDESLFTTITTEEDFAQAAALSRQLPIILDFWASWCEPCKKLTPLLEQIIHEYSGRFQLARIDIDQAKNIAQAFRIQSVPAVYALIGGQPMPLFQGSLAKQQIKAYFDQLLQAAQKAGIVGRLNVEEVAPEPTPEEKAINDAIAAKDYAQAETLLATELENHPKDSRLTALLSEVKLQQRLEDEQRQAQESGHVDDSDPLVLADQFVAAGNSPAAYRILLDILRQTHGADPESSQAQQGEAVRERIIELFHVDANTDAVSDARRELSDILFS